MNKKESLVELSTIGIIDYFHTYKLSDGSLVNVHIKDTLGQERFESLSQIYYRKADGILLVYDISNQESFEKIKNNYIKEIKNNCPKHVKVILLGNKTDLERKIDITQASSLAEENNYIYKETSCIQNKNVADAFETLIEITHRDAILNNRGKKNNIVISKESSNTPYSCWC
jgi:small GTP-binding protein